MRFRATSLSKLLVTLALTLPALSGHAVLLNQGDTLALPGTTVAAEPQLAGTVLIDELIPFSFSAGVSGGLITGTVQQRVVRSSLDGTVDFYWKVNNDANSAASIGSFRVGNFNSPEYNANWRIDGLGTKAPDHATRFSGTFASFVNFNFDIFSGDPADGIQPGTSSRFFFLDTTAKNFSKTAAFDLTNLIQNPISDQFAAYGPLPVPEPAMFAYLGLGFALLFVMVRLRPNI